MIERPILFSGPMVRAILAGKKTQTRRVITPSPAYREVGDWPGSFLWKKKAFIDGGHLGAACPYGVAGDRLWVRETFYERFDGLDDVRLDGFAADGEKKTGPVPATAYEAMTEGSRAKRPSIFMPRKYSRINLDLIESRAERLQEISEEDAKAEGCEASTSYEIDGGTARVKYHHLWDSINGKRGFGWAANPWVWVIEFRRLEANHV